jgi:hypothetical protein
MSVALVCIAKNEKLSIDEFISYYLKLGFTKIYIYDNSDDNELASKNSSNVLVIPFKGTLQQTKAYNNFLIYHKKKYNYVAFFDCDEFLVLKKHNNIYDFCQEYVKKDALGINWCMFGNNGHEHYEDKPVVERFTKRDNNIDKHVKTIANCNAIQKMNIHHPAKLSFECSFKDINGNNIKGPFAYNVSNDIVQLNHYFCKSTDELREKCARGRADIIRKRKFEDHLSTLTLNHVEDLSAYNFYFDVNKKIELKTT